jgi:hypothetical protein
MKTETQLTSQLLRAGRMCRAEILSLHGHDMQAPGWPDAYIAHPYWIGWIEFKGPNTKIEPHQQKIIASLRDKGVNVFVVRFLEQEKLFWNMRIQNEIGAMYSIFTHEGPDAKVFSGLMLRLCHISQPNEGDT